jgi:hypothetical protein
MIEVYRRTPADHEFTTADTVLNEKMSLLDKEHQQ